MKCFRFPFIFILFLQIFQIFSELISKSNKLESNNNLDSFLLHQSQQSKSNNSDTSIEFLENFIEKNNLSDLKLSDKKPSSKMNHSKTEMLKKLKETLEKYVELKKKKELQLKKTNDNYFFKRLFKYDYQSALKVLESNSTRHRARYTNHQINSLKKKFEKLHLNFTDDINFRFKSKPEDKKNPDLVIFPIQKFNQSLIKVEPLNIILQNTSIVTRNDKPIQIRNELYQKILEFRKNKLKNDEKVIPIEQCNMNWDYSKRGDDWNCLCQCGKRQSPINIKINSSKDQNRKSSIIRKLSKNFKIFFDFKDPKTCENSNERLSMCKKPLMKNNGKTLEIEYNCGIIVMPPHNNGYQCYKIEIHTPSEHKINNEQFDLELQIYYKMADRRIIDSSTTETITVVTFFKGIEKADLTNIKDTLVRNHPFLNQFGTVCIPKMIGEAKLLDSYLDFSLLFDKSKQPYQYKKINNRRSKKFSDLYTEVSISKTQKRTLLSAINELTYNKNNPLDEYYTYLGSFTSPPCIEDVTYIIKPKPLLAPLDQIIEISKIISKCNSIGNNRNIQNLNERHVYQFESENPLEGVFEQLNLLGDFSNDVNIDFLQTGERGKKKNFDNRELYESPDDHDHSLKSEEGSCSNSEHIQDGKQIKNKECNDEECNDEELIDKIIDTKDKDVELFLKNNNLK